MSDIAGLAAHGMAIYRLLRDTSGGDAGQIKAAFAGTLSSICGQFDDEEWEQIMSASKMPCGIPDCTCELSTEKVFTGLDAGRAYWKEVMASR